VCVDSRRKTPLESIAGDAPDTTSSDERGATQDMQMTGQSAGTIAGSPPLVKGDQLGESPPQPGHDDLRMLVVGCSVSTEFFLVVLDLNGSGAHRTPYVGLVAIASDPWRSIDLKYQDMT